MNTKNIVIEYNSSCQIYTKINNINNNYVIKMNSTTNKKSLELFINNILLCVKTNY